MAASTWWKIAAWVSRAVRLECPAALAIIAAHSDLEDLVLERDVHHEKARLEIRWAELVYDGMWFHRSKRHWTRSCSRPSVTSPVTFACDSRRPGSCASWVGAAPRALRLRTGDLRRRRQIPARRFRSFVKIYGLGIKTWPRDRAQKTRPTAPMTLWSGRFSSPMAASLWDLSQSYSFDHISTPTTSWVPRPTYADWNTRGS